MPKFSIDPQDVLRKYRVIAVVGASKSPEKDAYAVPAYLLDAGYEVVPINPTADSIHGVKAYHTLAEVPGDLAKRLDVVDVFRPSSEFPEVARQVAQMKRSTGRPFVFWGQLGLEDEEAKGILAAAGVDYVMDRCMRTEHKVMGRSFTSFGGRVNAEWHEGHGMPESPTRAQRAQWHFEHAEACGCRPVPEDLADEVRGLIRAANEGTRPG
ncbi:MAG: CoA-binding protein [Thaumarchaeota archaeon]|nr:CoA-binding protein [Nitrososphaerota archaeon]